MATWKGSLDDLMTKVRCAVRERFASGLQPSDEWPWCKVIYPDHVIVEKGDDLYSVGYTVGATGEVVLSEGEPARVAMTFVPLAGGAVEEAVVTAPPRDGGESVLRQRMRVIGPRVQEGATEPDGSLWEVVIIEEGLSKNRNRYGRKCLQEAVGLYDQARIYVDHADEPRRFGRSVRDLAGFIASPQVVVLGTKEGTGPGTVMLTGTACLVLPWLKEAFLNAWRVGNPSLFGFSHDVAAKSAAVMLSDGPAYDVEAIGRVDSVDVVTNPAAGGRLTRLVASDTAPASLEGDGRMLQQMIEAIKKHRPDLAAKLSATPTETDVLALYAEAIQPAATSTKEAAAPPTAPVPAGAVVIQEADWKAAQAQIKEGARHIATLNLERNLVECALPDPLKTRIRKRFSERIKTDQIPSDDEIVTAIKESVEDYGALADAKIVLPHVAGSAQVVKDRRDKLQEALDDFFDPKKPLQSFKAIYIDITGDAKVTGKVKEAVRLTESLNSSSFDQILGDSINRRMLAEYKAPEFANWRNTIAEVVPLSDFRTQRRMRFGGYGNLPIVSQGGAYLGLTSPTDEEATYAPSKRGGTEVITLEAIKNDDVGAIRRIPSRLGRSAGQTLHEFVWDFLGNNGVVYDTTALAAVGHSNIVTSALSGSNITSLRLKMKQQTDMSNGKRLGLVARYLIVPSELEELAFQLTTSDRVMPDTNISTTGAPAAPSFIRKLNLQPITVEYWTDTNNYWITASVDQTPMIEIGFLDGAEDPELFVQDVPTQGSLFSNDQITYKIRHIYGGGVMDFRGFAAGIVA